MADAEYYIGLMSGTSSDAIDAALISVSSKVELIATHSSPITTELRQQIHQLCDPQRGTIDQLGHLDYQLGHAFADTALALIADANIPREKIIAIGSHGQTIRHRPSANPSPFTLQIGDPNIIAEKTGITTIADFRRRDMALGGQGAPLVPAFHRAIFSSDKTDRAIVNIGGMANITWLPKSQLESDVIGFDTGPGNVLLDAWIYKHFQKSYDQNGNWAAQGNTHQHLLDLLLGEEFFGQAPPKSTGREMFNLAWLENNLQQLHQVISPIDVQRTLLTLTAKSIADSINHLARSNTEVYVCGGGALNQLLMKELEELLTPYSVNSTRDLGIDPQWIEAMAFAWLAHQRMKNKTGNIAAVTGAKNPGVLGGIYFGATSQATI